MAYNKPPFGTPIDADSWLFSQMQPQGMYALNEYTGGLLNDGTENRLSLAATGFGSTNPWGPASQNGIIDQISSACFKNALPASLRFGWPMSVAVGFRKVANGTAGNQRLFALSPVNTNISPYISIGFYFVFDTSVKGAFANGSGFVSTAGGTISLNIDYILSFTVTSSNYMNFLNGVQVDNGSGAYSTPAWGSGSQIILNGWDQIGSLTGSIVYWACWSNTAWPASVHQYLGQSVNNIWGMYPGRGSPIFGPWRVLSVGSAPANSTASAIGASLVLSVAAASGDSAATGIGASLVLSVGAASGSSIASAIGAALASTAGTALATSTALAIGDAVTTGGTLAISVGTAAASSTGIGVIFVPYLLIPYALHSATIIPTASPESPWTIDPDRTQELPLTVTPGSPWSIDPERTQEF